MASSLGWKRGEEEDRDSGASVPLSLAIDDADEQK